MPKESNKKKRRTKTKILSYPESSVEAALQEIRDGSSINSASIKYNIPYSTLFYKHSGKNPIERKMGPSTYLSAAEENCLVEWIQTSAKRGFPITKIHLLDSVQMLIKKLKRNTPFKNSRPGRHWYESFVKRHPQLSLRIPQNLTSSRATVTEDRIRQWFREIELYFTENDYLNIIEDPRRVFNSDESAFFLNPKESKVLVRKGDKTVYNFIGNDEKECLTTLITGNAAGELSPPMVMFTYERVPANVSKRIPDNWGVGRSESGWMTGETFYEFITNVFLPWIKESQIDLPVVLYVDGHRSHLTLALSKFCSENGIILVALYPNSTHILQPMDVAVFHVLKSAWRTEVRNWKIKNDGKKISKEFFCPILEKALTNSIKKETLINGFRSCGLCPLNADAIRYEKYFKNNEEANETTRPEPASENVPQVPDGFLPYLENIIGVEKINTFLNLNDLWQEAEQDRSLFYVWKKIKTDLETDLDLNQIREPDTGDHELPSELPYESYDANFEHAHFIDTNATVTSEGDIVLDGDWINEPVYQSQEQDKLHLDIYEKNETQQEIDPPILSKINIISNVILRHKDSKESITDDENGIEDKYDDNNVQNEIPTILQENPDEMLPNIPENVSEDEQQQQDEEEEEENGVQMGVRLGIDTPSQTKINYILSDDEHDGIEDENDKNIQNKTAIIQHEISPEKMLPKIPENIPSPFKTALFWPEVCKSTKPKRSKEKIPTVVTSAKWKEYHQKKDDEKKRKEHELNERKRKRAEKKEEQELKKRTQETKRTKLSKDKPRGKKNEPAEPITSDTSYTSENETIIYKTESFVIVKYEGEYFPGKILNLTDTQARVNVMKKSGMNGWKWPHPPDVLWYEKEDVVKVILEPAKLNNRGVYTIDEMKNYNVFIN